MWWRRHSSIFLQMRPVSTLLVKESQSKYLAPTGICLKGARWYQDLWNRQHTCCLLHLVSVRPSNAQHFSTTPEPKKTAPRTKQSRGPDLRLQPRKCKGAGMVRGVERAWGPCWRIRYVFPSCSDISDPGHGTVWTPKLQSRRSSGRRKLESTMADPDFKNHVERENSSL